MNPLNETFRLPVLTIANDFKGKGQAAKLHWRIEENWTLDQLFVHLTRGYPVAVGWYDGEKSPSRRSKDFIRGWLIGLDFDDLTPTSASQLRSDAFVTTYAAFTYTTPSHTPEMPRLRVFFVTDQPIEGKDRYEKTVAKLLHHFALYAPDTACSDAARLFFGNPSPDGQYTTFLNNILPLSVLDTLPDPSSEHRVSGIFNSEKLPSAFIQAVENAIHFTGQKHDEFLECHCPIHPPDDQPSANWHPDKHFLWCFHERKRYLAKEVGESLGIRLQDFTTRRQTNHALSFSLPNESIDAIPALRLDENFESLEPDQVAQYAALNEYGDARLLMEQVKGRLAFDRSQRAWYWWAGNWWKKDERGKTAELLYMPVGELYANAAGEYATRQAKLEAQLASTKDDLELQNELNRIRAIAKELSNRPRSLRTHTRGQNVLQIASGLHSLVGSEWDADPMMFCVNNGVIDLETGNLRHGQLSDYARMIAPVDYDPAVYAPRWSDFLREIFDGDQAVVEFVQRLFGYCITGATAEHILPVFYGRGRNGKDTLIEAIGYVLGDYACSGSGDLLIEQHQFGQATPHLYDLMGRRLVWVTETGEGAKLNVNQVKYITGAGRITARPLYGGFVEFDATHHVILFTNHKPRVPSQNEDYAIWKRLLLIPLTLSFVDNPLADYERRRDPRLKHKLREEAQGILNWLVQGCIAWQRQGLNPPPSILQATEEYARSEDLIAQFIEERCDFHPVAREQAQALYEAFTVWAKQNGYPLIGGRKFGERLTAQFPKERARSGLIYVGLKLRTLDE